MERPLLPAENDQVGSSSVPDDFYERIKERIRTLIAGRLHFAGQVVEFGCGSCELARFLARENRQHVTGVDVSSSSFPEGENAQDGVECRKADARALDFIQDRSVDAVVSVHALHEMENPVEVMREANRVLRGEGMALVVDFPRDSLAQRLWNENYYAPKEVHEMLRQAGFAGVESRLIARGQLIWAEAHKALAGKEMR